LVTVPLKGVAYFDVNSPLRGPEDFFLYVVVPGGLGSLCLLLALLPRIMAINLMVFVGLVTLAEGMAWWLAEPEPRGEPAVAGQAEFYVRDPVLGHTLTPNIRAQHLEVVGREQIFNVTYELDEFARRRTPTSGTPRPRFVLFFGDSNMFGYGVTERQTIPYYVGELARDYQPYNYGVPGYGPAHLLELAKRLSPEREIQEREGAAVFFLIPGHIARVIGASEVLDYGAYYPYYTLGPRDHLRAKGNFAANRPFTTLAYYAWNRSNVARYFEVGLPLRYSEADYALAARIFGEATSLLKSKLRLRGLYVIMGQAYDDREMQVLEKMKGALEREGVRHFDYTQLFDPWEPQYHLADLHNSAQANEAMARQLVTDLRIGK
jgi:hypothetical protein